MSLVIDLIGQLNCHVIGCKTGKVDWCVSIRLLFRSVYCWSNCQFSLLFVCFGVVNKLVVC